MNIKIHKYTNIYKMVHLLLKISPLFLKTEYSIWEIIQFEKMHIAILIRMTYNFLYRYFFLYIIWCKNL